MANIANTANLTQLKNLLLLTVCGMKVCGMKVCGVKVCGVKVCSMKLNR